MVVAKVQGDLPGVSQWLATGQKGERLKTTGNA